MRTCSFKTLFQGYILIVFAESKRSRKEPLELDVSGSEPSSPAVVSPSSPRDSQSSLHDGRSPERPSSVPRSVSPKSPPHMYSANGGLDSPPSTGEPPRSETIPTSTRTSASAGSSSMDGPSVSSAMVGSLASAAQYRRAPLDTLTRVFPHMKRSVLQLILQGCNGDAMAAIEQVLNNHSQEVSSASSGSSTSTPSVGPMAVAHRPYMSLPHSMTPGSAGVKSAFSPITSLAAANAMGQSPLRYAYAGLPNARGLAVAMPYPAGFMPNLAATLGYGYSALAGAQKTGISPYGICGCPYGSESNDK